MNDNGFLKKKQVNVDAILNVILIYLIKHQLGVFHYVLGRRPFQVVRLKSL